jgi:sensor histidine kinase YesM
MTTKQASHYTIIEGNRNLVTVHMEQYPFIFSNERKFRIRRHLAFWTFWWIFQGILYAFAPANINSGYLQHFPVSLAESFVFLFNHIFLAYSLMYFVIPRFLLKQLYWHTAISTIILFVITAFISSFLGRFVVLPLREFLSDGYIGGNSPYIHSTLFLSLLAGLRGGITIAGIAAAIKLMKYWYMKEQRNLQLLKENADSQLQLLKAQVHPHFLFNTLNNIYSYTQNTSPVASKLVSGLSDMLRFMLYECNQPLVPLSRELTMVRDYMSLEQIRYGNKLDLHVDIPDNTSDLHIAPLLLLPFLENCFKHGTSQVLDQPWISLQVRLYGTHLHMKLLNGKLDSATIAPNSGIGVENVRKRLQLIYPGKHELIITNEEEIFIVNLRIELQRKKITVENPVVEENLLHA